MFIAHLPAGYLLTRALPRPDQRRVWWMIGLAGSVLPDADLAWFYLVDHRRHVHHDYWTHLPIFWAGVAVAVVLLARRGTPARASFDLLLPNVLLHLLLDSVVGHLEWLGPWNRHRFAIWEVPAGHAWWVLNFVLHWTFLLEIAIVGLAAGAWIHARTPRPVPALFRRESAILPGPSWPISSPPTSPR